MAVFAVIDRRSNNVLGEYAERDPAESLYRRLVEADPSVRDYEKLEPWHRKRYLVLPGITGLWQISGRSELTFDDLVRLDFYYLENWSIWLDISILARTIPAVIAARGAY